MPVKDVIFCISVEERERIYDALRSLDQLRRLMNREGSQWMRQATSLKIYTDNIAHVLSALPRDPRCATSGRIDPDSVVSCPTCTRNAGPAHRIIEEGQRRTLYLRCGSCGYQWTIDD